MDLEKKSCENCKKEFKEGQILIKNENKLYHHLVQGDAPPLSAILSCSLVGLDTGKVGIFYKGAFYDLEKNMDKLEGINVSHKGMQDEKDPVYGSIIVGNLSFLNKLTPD